MTAVARKAKNRQFTSEEEKMIVDHFHINETSTSTEFIILNKHFQTELKNRFFQKHRVRMSIVGIILY